MTPAGAVVTAVAFFVVTAGGVLFYRLSRKSSTKSGVGLRVLAIVVVGLFLGAAIVLARTLGG